MMSDFIESAKNLVNSAVSRTGWEAQKQMRVRGKQGEIDKLLEQRQKLLDDLSLTAMNLYQQGALTDSRLSRLCASVLELDHDVKKREGQLQDIKNEGYAPDQYGSAQTPDYTPPPVNPTPSPAGTGQQAGASTGGQPLCPNCGKPIRANALYCRDCGAKLR
jgi:hypothetical protein